MGELPAVIILPPCPSCGHILIFVGDVVVCPLCVKSSYLESLEEVGDANRN